MLEILQFIFQDFWHFVGAAILLYIILPRKNKEQTTTDELTAWDVFEAITSAYGGKQIFFLQKNGMVYDRYKADYITFEEAINRFCKMIGDDEQ